METKIQKHWLHSLKSKIGFEGIFCNWSYGKSEGIAPILWKEEAKVEIQIKTFL